MGYSYGTANQAFDPHSELDDISHGSFQVNGATLKVTTSSEEEEEEDSVTPRQEHISRGVLKLGSILIPDVGLRHTCAYYHTSAHAMCMRKCVQKGL